MAAQRAIGITCGIGSLLVGAKQAGFDIVGNIEWRDYYHAKDSAGRNTFTENFPDAVFKSRYEDLTPQEIERMMNPTLALGHPECGKYSVMSGALRDRAERLQDPSDIPLFVDLVAKLRPRYFVMDDLPKSLGAFPMAEYHTRLPDYDLFPEWVSNWGYGNVQKHRNRMFMLGALKSEGWTFVPGEAESDVTIRSTLEDLGEPRAGSNFPNHDPHDNSQLCYRGLHLNGRGNRPTWNEMAEYFRDRRPGDAFEYPQEDGTMVRRIGFMRDHWDRHGYVITGGNPIMHNVRCDPYTVRERARIQGFPDDFVFYGTELNERGEWHHFELTMVKQTGKAMPVQFARYVSRQVMAHVESKPFDSTRRRILKSNPHVDEAKQWYCQNVGYADQEAACGACWMAADCAIRVDRYGYTPLRKPVREIKISVQRKSNKPKSCVKPEQLPLPLTTMGTTATPAVAIATRVLSFGGKR